jgi:hypothetical protein
MLLDISQEKTQINNISNYIKNHKDPSYKFKLHSDEKIKEGNYTYHRVFGVGKITNVNGKKCFVTIKLSSTDGSITTPWKRNIPDIKKIILTTDPQLIADGVQAIDDEFLEWFVKNPSCERVEVENERDILDAYNREDISYSRMNEMFNELADEFAIGFAEWLVQNYDGIKSVKELLEIYKQEKGL